MIYWLVIWFVFGFLDVFVEWILECLDVFDVYVIIFVFEIELEF